MDKYEAALRTASAIYHLGWNSLSLTEESLLQGNSEFRERVEEYLERLKNGESIRRSRRVVSIILDQPLMSYSAVLSSLCHQFEHVHVDFLCSDVPELSHFNLCVLEEYGISYTCLNILTTDWEEWKKRPEYRGQ